MWAQIINALLGIWLMAAPAVLGVSDAATTNDRIVGPIVAAFATVAAWEVTRPLRWVNLPLGLWLVLAPWVLGYGTASTANSMVVGAVIVALSLVKGKIGTRYGGGWRTVLRGNPEWARDFPTHPR